MGEFPPLPPSHTPILPHPHTQTMTQLRGMLLLTFRELWAKKVIIGLFIVVTIVWLFLTFALSLDAVEGSLAGVRLYDQGAPPAQNAPPGAEDFEGGSPGASGGLLMKNYVLAIESVVAGASYWIGTLLALFATAPLLTGLLQRGHVDLLLSKPLSRTRLLAGHVLGVLAMMLLLSAYLIGAVWLTLSIKTGVWNPRFLLAIFVLVGMFAVLYAVVTLVGVWTRSTALALIVTYGLIFISIVLAGHEQIERQLAPAGRFVFRAFYHVLPGFAEVTNLVAQLSSAAPVARWEQWYPFASSLAFGAVLYGLAAFWFSRRDF